MLLRGLKSYCEVTPTRVLLRAVGRGEEVSPYRGPLLKGVPHPVPLQDVSSGRPRSTHSSSSDIKREDKEDDDDNSSSADKSDDEKEGKMARNRNR